MEPAQLVKYVTGNMYKINLLNVKQVMKFFTEQRRDLEETLAALESKKRGFQSRVRAFFSALIKACMDVEKKLLEELETSVSDHTDILQEHSKAWLELQENMQLILDQSELLLNLPSLGEDEVVCITKKVKYFQSKMHYIINCEFLLMLFISHSVSA